MPARTASPWIDLLSRPVIKLAAARRETHTGRTHITRAAGYTPRTISLSRHSAISLEAASSARRTWGRCGRRCGPSILLPVDETRAQKSRPDWFAGDPSAIASAQTVLAAGLPAPPAGKPSLDANAVARGASVQKAEGVYL